MTILRNGEKWACKQCIQGHRVSTCTHEDRPLLHVARKGRPVSQCVHCRGLRKARAQHVKCDCGERRFSHSRNNSSESNTTTGDEKACQCFHGKKCTCALKKEPGTYETNLSVPSNGLEPFFDRDTGKPHIPARRSEGAVPRFRHTYQPGLQRSGYSPQESRNPYLSSPLARGVHVGMRSVDSLPLFLDNRTSPSSQTALPPTAFHHPVDSGQFTLDPPQQQHLLSSVGNLPDVPSFGNFSVEPLPEAMISRHLTARHPNQRHSISGALGGQWAMALNSDLQHLQHLRMGESQLYSSPQSAEPAAFPFPPIPSQQAWHGGWGNLHRQQPPPLQSSTGSGDSGFPGFAAHSRSSSGTASEPFDPPSYNANHPTIQIDPSPTWTTNQDEKGWSTASYGDAPPDFSFPGDAVLPNYSDEYSAGDHSDYSDFGTYTYPPAVESRQNSLDSLPPPQSLPNRSFLQWGQGGRAPASSLPQFKFPMDPQPDHTEAYDNESIGHYEWQQSQNDNVIVVKEEDRSPYDQSPLIAGQ